MNNNNNNVKKKIKDDNDNNFSTARECCQAARSLWLSTHNSDDLRVVEKLYLRALHATRQQQPQSSQQQSASITPTNAAKKIKTDNVPLLQQRRRLEPLTSEEYQHAGERLALLMCQSGRANQMAKALRSLGFTCRLATQVLDYPMIQQPQTTDIMSTRIIPPDAAAPCIMIDNFLSPAMFQFLRHVFDDPQASYWIDHQYQLEPPSPYVSYIIPLADINMDPPPPSPPLHDINNHNNNYGGLGVLIHQLYTCSQLRHRFPNLATARFVELWAHNRPHASGHQLHFDSDDEGRGGGGSSPRHPILSTILYLSDDHIIIMNDSIKNNHNNSREEEDQDDDRGGIIPNGCCGGPSLVTSQTLTECQLATHGWLCHPRPRRLVAFEGNVLHGVIPGKGSVVTMEPIGSNEEEQERKSLAQQPRRVTCMLAFWQDITVRGDTTNTPGSARPFPVPASSLQAQAQTQQPQWARDLCQALPTNVEDDDPPLRNDDAIRIATPIFIDHVYETLQGEPWSQDIMGFPGYDQIFQGF
jgi:hypothetical protein